MESFLKVKETMNKQMNQLTQLYLAETIKDFNENPVSEGEFRVHFIEFPCNFFFEFHSELHLPPQLNRQKEQMSFIRQLADGMGISVKSVESVSINRTINSTRNRPVSFLAVREVSSSAKNPIR